MLYTVVTNGKVYRLMHNGQKMLFIDTDFELPTKKKTKLTVKQGYTAEVKNITEEIDGVEVTRKVLEIK